MPEVPRTELNDGTSIPQLGFGVYLVPDDVTERVVSDALAAGYRSIDTAALYQNEAGVGKAIRESGLARDELYVTTKVWNDMQGRERTLRAFDQSMELLGLERLDLLLIHWPAPGNDLYVETWETFIELRATGRVTSIGVSNFEVEHLHADHHRDRRGACRPQPDRAAPLPPAARAVRLPPSCRASPPRRGAPSPGARWRRTGC